MDWVSERRQAKSVFSGLVMCRHCELAFVAALVDTGVDRRRSVAYFNCSLPVVKASNCGHSRR